MSASFASLFVLLCVSTVCHGTVTVNGSKYCQAESILKSYKISSPGFNAIGTYPANTYCEYAVKLEDGQRASLNFTVFEIQGAMSNCSAGDNVEVRVGCGSQSKSVGVFCSNVSLPAFHSPDNCLTVIFKSDHKRCSGGFEGIITGSSNNSSISGSCSDGKSTNMISPNWPLDYKSGDKCTWVVDTNGTSAVGFFFTSFLLETRVDCDVAEDGVAFYGVYENQTRSELEILCSDGQTKLLINTTEFERLEVEFAADNDGSTASGIAGGYVLIEPDSNNNGVSCIRTTDATPTGANTTGANTTSRVPTSGSSSFVSPPVKGPLLVLAVTAFIFLKWG